MRAHISAIPRVGALPLQDPYNLKWNRVLDGHREGKGVRTTIRRIVRVAGNLWGYEEVNGDQGNRIPGAGQGQRNGATACKGTTNKWPGWHVSSAEPTQGQGQATKLEPCRRCP